MYYILWKNFLDIQDGVSYTSPNKKEVLINFNPKINRRTGRISKPGQPYGEESWKALEIKIMHKQVKLDIVDIDRYRRMVGVVWLDDRNINLEMVTEGYAEAYVEYLKYPYRSEFIKAEQEAKSAKKGIWKFTEYERPKDFRKRLRVRGAD